MIDTMGAAEAGINQLCFVWQAWDGQLSCSFCSMENSAVFPTVQVGFPVQSIRKGGPWKSKRRRSATTKPQQGVEDGWLEHF